MKVLKDFYRNKGFKGSPREPANINSTVNIVLVTNKSNAKRAVTSFFKSYPCVYLHYVFSAVPLYKMSAIYSVNGSQESRETLNISRARDKCSEWLK